MKRASAVFTALFLLSASAAFSQGNFLKKGQYGLGLSGAYATNSSASGYSGTVGVALGGIFDLSFGAGHAAFDTSEYGDLTSNSLAPELRAHVIKQNSSKSPVSLSLSIGYAKDDFASPELEPAGIGAMWMNSFILGATVYRDVPLSGKLYLQPYVGVSHTSSTFKLTVISTGVTWSDKDGHGRISGRAPGRLQLLRTGAARPPAGPDLQQGRDDLRRLPRPRLRFQQSPAPSGE